MTFGNSTDHPRITKRCACKNISREQIAGMVEEAWRTLRDQIDATPSIYYAGVRPGDA